MCGDSLIGYARLLTHANSLSSRCAMHYVRFASSVQHSTLVVTLNGGWKVLAGDDECLIAGIRSAVLL